MPLTPRLQSDLKNSIEYNVTIHSLCEAVLELEEQLDAANAKIVDQDERLTAMGTRLNDMQVQLTRLEQTQNNKGKTSSRIHYSVGDKCTPF